MADAPRRPPEGSEVHVWLTTLTGSRASGASLSADEVARARRFRFDRDRALFTAGRAWLRVVVAAYAGADPSALRFGEHPDGKPYLADPAVPWLRFNASGSAGRAAAAIASGLEVGIDVERIRDSFPVVSVAGRFFTAGERAMLEGEPASSRALAFYTLWTCKEALVKACGTGLREPLPELSRLPGPGECVRVVMPDRRGASGDWSVQPFDAGPGFAGAVALAGAAGITPVLVPQTAAGDS